MDILEALRKEFATSSSIALKASSIWSHVPMAWCSTPKLESALGPTRLRKLDVHQKTFSDSHVQRSMNLKLLLILDMLTQKIANSFMSASMEKFHEEMDANWDKFLMRSPKIVTGLAKFPTGEFFIRFSKISSSNFELFQRRLVQRPIEWWRIGRTWIPKNYPKANKTFSAISQKAIKTTS